uniref:Uncharacterized protein n=1 Tax=Myoviridae sp. ctEg02 TaxID=2825061 RepID=A0A8S5PRB7_9CAUD|nr:MAG TPA: hypothetical protein [Myoviridae sp. ctEg02]
MREHRAKHRNSSMCKENMYEMDKEVKGDRHEH